MDEPLDYSKISRFDPQKYSVKCKLIVTFWKNKFCLDIMKSFLISLSVREFGAEDLHAVIANFRINQVANGAVRAGYFGPRDNRPIIILENIDNCVVISIFNEPKYIMRDKDDIMLKLESVNLVSKLLGGQLVFGYPWACMESVSINNVDLKQPNIKNFVYAAAARYFLLYISTIGIVNLQLIWNTGLKVIVNGGSGVVLLIFLAAFYLELLFWRSKNRFGLEIYKE